jgi:hypothetical protein
MPGQPNKFTEGFEYISFPGNIGVNYCGFNFPESTAQDLSSSLYLIGFSGSSAENAVLQPILNAVDYAYGYGPSGFASYYNPILTLTGDRYGPLVIDYNGIAQRPPVGTPNLRGIFGVNNNATSNNDRAFNTVNTIGILDLVCEGPIQGFVTGIYVPNLSGKTTGDIGYTSVTFQPFDSSRSTAEARSIFWNDTPISDLQGFFNFQYVNYKYTFGNKTNDHTIYNPYLNLYDSRYDYFGRQVDQNNIPLQTSVTNTYGDRLYGGFQKTSTEFLTYPKTYYIYNTDVSSLKVNIQVDGLFESVISGNAANVGDVLKQTSNIRFVIYRLFKDGSVVRLDTSRYYPYQSEYYSRDEVQVKGKITAPSIFTYEIMLRPYAENKPNFPLFQDQIGWVIDILKTSAEPIGTSLQNKTFVNSITEVYSDRFVYPDSALVYTQFDARYFSSIPTRTYKMQLLKIKVPSNYDPISRTYSGPWNGQFKVAWSDNPAWCFYDLLTNNRFGLGKYINTFLVDKWTLYEISQYCDTLVSDGNGGLEPRFTCNVMIASKDEAYKVLNDMASIFRGIIYYSAGQIFINQDKPKDPIYLFNNSNVVDGDFTYSDSSKKVRRTVATVRYNDENDNYKPAIEYVEDKEGLIRYGVREIAVSAFGCTSRNQARRLGKWYLMTENQETETVTFKAGLEGNFLSPGDVIQVYDQNRKINNYAGRTLELTTGSATLDILYTPENLNSITGVNNQFNLNFLTPTYNLSLGTYLGDLYATGFGVTTSGVTGLNSSFFRRSQLQSISINNPQLYTTSGSGNFSNYIKINLPSGLNNVNYNLPNNTVWIMDINPTGFSGLYNQSEINNPGNIVYPGYYLEGYLNEPKSYRVISVAEEGQDKAGFIVNALQYVPEKYSDIDASATLINVPIRPALPQTPNLQLSILFRDSANNYKNGFNVPYTSYQGGINSIVYNIRPPNNATDVTQYRVYEITGNNFPTSTTDEQYLLNVLSTNLVTGFDYTNNIYPPFFTPLTTGTFFFRAFSMNSLNERSIPPATGWIRLTGQASVDKVLASGINVI